jgi:hypothetical protein
VHLAWHCFPRHLFQTLIFCVFPGFFGGGSALSDVGTTPLHIACQNEQEEVVELLVNNGTDISPRNEADYTPFLMAAGKGNVIIPRWVQAHGSRMTITALALTLCFPFCTRQ